MKISNECKIVRNELDEFKNSLESSIGEIKNAYESSRLAYEFALKNFIVKEISSKKKFPSIYKNTYAELYDSLRHEKGCIAIDKLMVLETIINERESYIEEYELESED